MTNGKYVLVNAINPLIFACLIVAVTMLSSCANTIRGMGHDAANTVDATQSAGRSLEKSAR
jgi:entericidin B